ncbi:MAG TPA: DAK2 domain-containing protein [Anaerolineae bacterium]|nr:DAK2 domain-containing protein [Anaerolineae bacterium]
MSSESQNKGQVELFKHSSDHPIDGMALKKLASAGLKWLKTNQEVVNSLNVFPVPDGDTGTNMVLTMQSAFDEIADSPEENIGKMAQKLSHGALMGARGNSGVILSQILRGFARALDDNETLDIPTLVKGLIEAKETAYKGVVRPVEGTILTVAKDIAIAAEFAQFNTDDPILFLQKIVEAADQSVQKTPDLLPVLKEAGVVDSGGKGLFYLFEGMLKYIKGEPLDTSSTIIQPISALNLENTLESIEPGQDFEVVVDFSPNKKLNLEKFYSDLEQMGTSIQVGEGDGMYRMHIHVPTEKRYEPIDYTMTLGTIKQVHLENLVDQISELQKSRNQEKIVFTPVEPGQIAVIAVSPGKGLTRVFASLGVTAIVAGGQTMNPSTKEIIAAFDNLPANKIIILPNNKNIIMAAEAAKDVTVKTVAVIPSKTVPEGLSAMLRYVPDGDFTTIVKDMNDALDDVETGEITTATRDVEIDGVQVKRGEIIALLNGKLLLSAKSLEDGCLKFLEKAKVEEFELITLFYGENIKKSEANRIVDLIRNKYPNLDIEVQEGGQPHYQFIISLE